MKTKNILTLALVAGLTLFAGNAKADFNYSFTPGYALGTGWNILSPVTGTIFGSFNANGTSFNLTGISASNGNYSSLFDNVIYNNLFIYNNLSIIGGQIEGQVLADAMGNGGNVLVDFSGGPYGYQSIYQPTSNYNVFAGNGATAATVTSVPEPSTYGLIGIGALGVAFAARRRKQKAV